MASTPIRLFLIVHYRIGSLESDYSPDGVVHYRIGSLEKCVDGYDRELTVHYRIGSLENIIRLKC